MKTIETLNINSPEDIIETRHLTPEEIVKSVFDDQEKFASIILRFKIDRGFKKYTTDDEMRNDFHAYVFEQLNDSRVKKIEEIQTQHHEVYVDFIIDALKKYNIQIGEDIVRSRLRGVKYLAYSQFESGFRKTLGHHSVNSVASYNPLLHLIRLDVPYKTGGDQQIKYHFESAVVHELLHAASYKEYWSNKDSIDYPKSGKLSEDSVVLRRLGVEVGKIQKKPEGGVIYNDRLLYLNEAITDFLTIEIIKEIAARRNQNPYLESLIGYSAEVDLVRFLLKRSDFSFFAEAIFDKSKMLTLQRHIKEMWHVTLEELDSKMEKEVKGKEGISSYRKTKLWLRGRRFAYQIASLCRMFGFIKK